MKRLGLIAAEFMLKVSDLITDYGTHPERESRLITALQKVGRIDKGEKA